MTNSSFQESKYSVMKSSFCSNFSGISPFLSPFGVTVAENDDEYNVVMFWKK